jgi:hypothetical protein
MHYGYHVTVYLNEVTAYGLDDEFGFVADVGNSRSAVALANVLSNELQGLSFER